MQLDSAFDSSEYLVGVGSPSDFRPVPCGDLFFGGGVLVRIMAQTGHTGYGAGFGQY